MLLEMVVGHHRLASGAGSAAGRAGRGAATRRAGGSQHQRAVVVLVVVDLESLRLEIEQLLRQVGEVASVGHLLFPSDDWSGGRTGGGAGAGAGAATAAVGAGGRDRDQHLPVELVVVVDLESLRLEVEHLDGQIGQFKVESHGRHLFSS